MLVHIGYHKTATTWVQHNLLPTHSQLVAPISPETISEQIVYPGPFDFDAMAAREYFTKAVASQPDRTLVLSCERLTGMPFGGGYDAKLIADRLFAVFPEARIWIVIRNQVDLLTSLYRHAVCWDANPMPVDAFFRDDPPALIPGVRLSHFEYTPLIAYYQSLFGDANVLVSAYEQLVDDPIEFVSNVDRFLGVSHQAGPDPSIVNPSFSDLSTMLLRRFNSVVGLIRRDDYLLTTGGYPAAALVSRETAHRMLRRLDRSRLARGYQGRLRRRIEALIGDRFDGSNFDLQRISGIDLAHYGYPIRI